MKKKRWVKIVVSSLMVIVVFTVVCIYNHFRMTTEKAITEINEECFELSVNLKEKTAEVDGETVKLTDLLALSDDELEEMVDNDSFEEFLEENLVGDMESEKGVITVKNPYSTKLLAVRTEDETIFDEYEDIISVEHMASNIYIVEFDNARHTKNGYQELLDDESVLLALKNQIVHGAEDVGNARKVSKESWGVRKTGLGHYVTKLNYAGKKEEIKVAVLDTGVNTSHEAFKEYETADRIDFTGSYNYVYDNDDASDDYGHGTAVAGVIAESTPSNVKIIPVKVLNSGNRGDMFDVLLGAKEVSQYADVLNMSVGTEPERLSDEEKEVYEETLQEISDKGIIVVCAAGNSAGAVNYPAACDSALAAAAVDRGNKVTYFSCHGDEIDFALPGYLLELPDYSDNTSYTEKSGTSFSSPFLASAVVNVMLDYGYTDKTDIVEVLKDNAVDLGEEGKDEYYGWGSLNFDSCMFATPVIAGFKMLDKEWAVENQIQFCAISASYIERFAITNSEVEPMGWKRVYTNVLEQTFTVDHNGTYYVWVKDENGNISHDSVTVEYVDNTAPSVKSFKENASDSHTISVNLSAEDTQSGISEITWYYKTVSDEQYTEEKEVCQKSGVGVQASEWTHEFSSLEADTEYVLYAEIKDIVGNTVQTETMSVSTSTASSTVIEIDNNTNGDAAVSIGEKKDERGDFSTTAEVGRLIVSCDKSFCVILEENGTSTKLEYTRKNENGDYEFDFKLANLKFTITK